VEEKGDARRTGRGVGGARSLKRSKYTGGATGVRGRRRWTGQVSLVIMRHWGRIGRTLSNVPRIL